MICPHNPPKDCNMNRLLVIAASRAAAPYSRSCIISTSSSSSFATSRCVFATRHFSDTDTSTSPDNTDDDDIKTGVVKHFNTKEAYGFIIPSWIDESNLQENDKIFIHRNDIRRVQLEDGSNSSGIYYPNLRRGDKVQFKLGPPDEGKKNGKGKVFGLYIANYSIYLYHTYCRYLAILFLLTRCDTFFHIYNHISIIIST